MSDKIKGVNRRYIYWIMLAVMIIAQLVRTACYMAFEREGYHSDEIWSYGLSNSYYQPFVYLQDGVYIDDADRGSEANLNKWVSGSEFNDYVTVQKGERFAYGSVYHNQTLDHHPPFYYALLHTICSFFPDRFSIWYSFVLNCIFLIVTQIFLFKLSRLVLRSDGAALTVCLLYGAGTGALSTFTFLRQYSMLTALIMMYTYFNAAYYYDDEKSLKKALPPIVITSFLAFMTHYYSIPYIGIFTAGMCVYLLCRRRIKTMFIYGGSVLASLIAFFAAYPMLLKHTTKNRETFSTKTFDFVTQLKRLGDYVLRCTVGVKVSIYRSSAGSIIAAILVVLIAIAVPLGILFRKETWFKNLMKKPKQLPKAIVSFFKSASFIPLMIFFASFAVLLVANSITDVVFMGYFTLRYLFAILPMACLLGVCIADIAIRCISAALPKLVKYRVQILSVLTALTIIRVNIISDCMSAMNGVGKFEEQRGSLSGKSCVVVLPYYADLWVLTNLSVYLSETEKTYVVLADELDERLDEIRAAGSIDRVLVTTNNYRFTNEQAKYLADKFPQEAAEEQQQQLQMNVSVDTKTAHEDIAYTDCTESLDSLAADGGYMPEYVINANNRLFYILED